MYDFPVLPRASLTRSDAHVMFLLVEQMYLQVGINSLLTADLASFIYLLLQNDVGEELMRK